MPGLNVVIGLNVMAVTQPICRQWPHLAVNPSVSYVSVGWVIGPVKNVPDMTYNVFGGPLNLAQLQLMYLTRTAQYGVLLAILVSTGSEF